MTFIENNHVIQTLASDIADEALVYGIRFWRTHEGFENINMVGYFREVYAKLLIIVTNQELRTFLKRGGIAPLLCDPDITRCASDAEVNHSSRSQLNNEETKIVRKNTS